MRCPLLRTHREVPCRDNFRSPFGSTRCCGNFGNEDFNSNGLGRLVYISRHIGNPQSHSVDTEIFQQDCYFLGKVPPTSLNPLNFRFFKQHAPLFLRIFLALLFLVAVVKIRSQYEFYLFNNTTNLSVSKVS